MRRRQVEEQALRALLARLGEDVEDIPETDLRATARRASAEGRQPQARAAQGRPWRPLRLRWAVATAVAMLLATGLGFGVASSLTPSGSAGSSGVSGLGFLPAEGWTVLQSGIPGSAESARIIAANVPIERPNRRIGLPLTALAAWPPWGIAIVARLSARGDPAVDPAFPVRTPPLRFADAVSVTATDYLLRAGVGGYNVDLDISFGSEPTAGMRRETEEQIARLVVAPAAITLAVRPTIYGRQGPLVVYGAVTSGKEGEKVTLQFKQCGLLPAQFRDHAETETHEGGSWSIETGIAANGAFRALSGGDVSNEVKVQARADVRLSPMRSGGYVVNVVARSSFWRKRVVIQKFDRARGTWVKLRTLVLDDQFAAPGSVFVWSTTGKFTLPKRVTARAVLPLDQARPCFIAGYSNLLRT
ncbi:MAG TPA: hypothetical protein VFR32_00210 [Gaiellaceae bacterium]|nr:hypothetical protein [Gaiellaceae bacterium]